MEKHLTISAEEIAEAMRSNPEFGMDVLAHFTQSPSALDTANFAEHGAANLFHEQAAPILHVLADDIIEALEGV